MNRRQFQRSPAKYGSGDARKSWLLHRKGDAAMDTGQMATYVGDKREMASRCDTHPVCSTCGRHTRYLRSVFAVHPIGPKGLAS